VLVFLADISTIKLHDCRRLHL